MTNNNHNGLYFIIGALIGCIGGILYAPKPGRETREAIKKTIDEHQDAIDRTKESAEDLIYRTKSQIEELIDNVSQSIESKIHKKVGETGKK
ncbi:MAG: hypothetical protein A2Y40_03940 [Candidatus Margulisbacteria bacterium GWF2_35_9]|nr:MAG: hypothetical protein A2Y40_03940 [Candidatus Margulisbacteria bacterium GWF2_35_9]